MTSQILRFVHFTKAQKSRYLENETLSSIQIKKFINYTSGATLLHKNLDILRTNRYLENETLSLIQIKKFINYTSEATLLQKTVNVVEATFNII